MRSNPGSVDPILCETCTNREINSEMYEACKTALTVTGGSKNWDGLTHGFLVEIEKAVAKAEGRRE